MWFVLHVNIYYRHPNRLSNMCFCNDLGWLSLEYIAASRKAVRSSSTMHFIRNIMLYANIEQYVNLGHGRPTYHCLHLHYRHTFPAYPAVISIVYFLCIIIIILLDTERREQCHYKSPQKARKEWPLQCVMIAHSVAKLQSIRWLGLARVGPGKMVMRKSH